MSVHRVDLNCDLGEGAGHDAELMALVTSANIACGVHAGDESTMRSTVALARQHGVAVGAHPSLNDRRNFGRLEMAVTPDEIYQLVLAQTRALRLHVQAAGMRLNHVKPHGALYNMAARNSLLADAVAQAVYEVDPRLVLYGRSGSQLVAAGHRSGLAVAEEVFADRSYQADGSLTPRQSAGALLASVDEALRQVLMMVREGRVRTTDGATRAVTAHTICIHGDGPDPVLLASRLRTGLEAAGITVAPYQP